MPSELGPNYPSASRLLFRPQRISIRTEKLTWPRLGTTGRCICFATRRQTKNHWLEVTLTGVKNLKLRRGARGGSEGRRAISEDRPTTGVPLVFRLGPHHRASRHGPHHLGERPDPERNEAARQGAHRQGSAAPLRLLPHDLHLERPASSSSSPTCWASRRWAPVPATANISRWITRSTFRFPREALAAGDGTLRSPHDRGTARGLLHRPGPTDGARPSGGHRNRHQRKVQVAAVPGVPPVRREAPRSTP